MRGCSGPRQRPHLPGIQPPPTAPPPLPLLCDGASFQAPPWHSLSLWAPSWQRSPPHHLSLGSCMEDPPKPSPPCSPTPPYSLSPLHNPSPTPSPPYSLPPPTPLPLLHTPSSVPPPFPPIFPRHPHTSLTGVHVPPPGPLAAAGGRGPSWPRIEDVIPRALQVPLVQRLGTLWAAAGTAVSPPWDKGCHLPPSLPPPGQGVGDTQRP